MIKNPETDNLARGNHVVPTEWAEQLERDEARLMLSNASSRVQTILDEGFGPQPADTIENNLSLLEQKIYEARAELARLTGKLGDMHEANIALGRERDEARDLALRYRSLYFAQNGIDVNEYKIPWEEAK